MIIDHEDEDDGRGGACLESMVGLLPASTLKMLIFAVVRRVACAVRAHGQYNVIAIDRGRSSPRHADTST